MLDTFTAAYVEAALFSTLDESTPSGGYPLDKNHSVSDIAEDTLAAIIADCAEFQAANWDDISDDLVRAGHDYWFTRNGHGAGFWDGAWDDDTGKRLTAASKARGELNLYIGDDKRLYAA